jgi:hypothetical protein
LSCTVPADPFGPTILTASEAIWTTYGVRVVLKPTPTLVGVPGSALEVSEAPSRDVAAYLPLLDAALAAHPQLVRCVPLRSVVLADRVTVRGESRTAVPLFAQGVLILQVTGVADHPDYLRHVLHHEFFHLLDARGDALVRDDVDWAALNPRGFRYGAGGDRAWRQRVAAFGAAERPAGFVSDYARFGAEEDKAETFAFLFAEPGKLAEIGRADPIVAAKRALLERRLRALCGAW